MIWGITLQPGEVCTKTVTSQLHLTLAALECRPSKVFERTTPVSFLVLKTTSCENVLCTLGRNQTFQQSLDLVFQNGEVVTFKVEGTGVVYITGYTPDLPQDRVERDVIPEADHTTVSSRELQYAEVTPNDTNVAPAPSADDFTNIKEEEDESEQPLQERFTEEESFISRGHDEVPIEINVSFPDVSEAPLGVYLEGNNLEDIKEDSENLQDIKDEIESEKVFPGDSRESEDYQAIGPEKEYNVNDDERQAISDYPEMQDDGMAEFVTVALGTDEDDQIEENDISSMSVTESDNFLSELHTSPPGESQEQDREPEGSETRHHQGGSDQHFANSEQNEVIQTSSGTVHLQGRDHLSPDLTQKTVLELPERTPHEIDTSLQCGFCGQTFGNHILLEKHERLHTVVRPFKCQFCDKSYAHRANVIIHERTHTGERPFRCRFCGKGFIQKYVQRVHERIHTGEKPHQCNVCGKAFIQKPHLTAHERTHDATKAYKCHICGKRFAQNASLVIHRRTHAGDQLLKCNQCEKSFIGQASLTEHVMKLHTVKKDHKCRMCEEAFHEIAQLEEHENGHSNVQQFQCEHCKKYFATEYSLRVHLHRMHTMGRLYKCQFCDKSYTQRANLKNHVRRHTGEKPFKCRFCTKAFIQKYGLTVHERTHTGEKPFQCNICGKAFTQSAHMIYHKKTHTKSMHEDVGLEKQKLVFFQK